MTAAPTVAGPDHKAPDRMAPDRMAPDRMAPDRIGPTAVVTGLAGLAELAWPAGRETVVVHDPRLSGAATLQRLLDQLDASSRRLRVVYRDTWADTDDARGLLRQLGAAEVVVTYGGGAVMDCTKVALALEDGRVPQVLATRQRCGWMQVPGLTRRRELVCVPTTVGTASEVSSLASVVHRGAKRALSAPGLAPDIAVLEPDATATLSRAQLVEGGLEALFRAVGPVIGDVGPDTPAGERGREVADERAMALAEDLAAWVCAVRTAPLDDERAREGRALVARWGVQTQDVELVRSRTPFVIKAWFVANDLSHHLGIRKMLALTALLPGYWQAIGRMPALGSPGRLAAAWSRLRRAVPVPLPDDPALGLYAWQRWLGVEPLPPLPPGECAVVARHVLRTWGAGLPMLGGLRHDAVTDLLQRAGRRP